MDLAWDHATGKEHADLMNGNVNHLYFIHLRFGVVIRGEHKLLPSLGALMDVYISRLDFSTEGKGL